MSTNAVESPFTGLEGTYIGISPTDESALVTGEYQITITHTELQSRWATGLEVQTDTMPVEDFYPLTESELLKMTENEADARRIRGFRLRDSEVVLVFVTDPSEDMNDSPMLVEMGSMADILGPTLLFGPEQVARGLHEALFRDLEEEYGQPGALPRLASRGLAPQDLA